jgi:UDP-GlcNAc:undecaprenyl-phosphate GlcNAc-1-phosphate transferase
MTLAFMLAVFVVALGIALLAVPRITRLALHKKLLDYPDGDRRLHARAVPRLGGVAVFAGFLTALGVGVLLDKAFGNFPTGSPGNVWRLLGACAVLFCIGLADDLKGVRPTLKLLGQVLAALIVCPTNIVVAQVQLPPDVTAFLGWASMPLTVLWLVGMSNAFNLVDGLDGLAGGVGVIALVAIASAGAIIGRPAIPVYSIALAGALLGFLRYNFSPARIFLGDSGSLVVGFLLAYLSVRGATQRNGTVFAIVPIFALAYPLLDTGVAMLRRWLRGDPLSRADGRHIHHQLLGLVGARHATTLIFAASIAMAVLGLTVTFGPPAMTTEVVLLGFMGLLLIIFYAVSWLDYHEFREAAVMMASGASRARGALRDSIAARDVAALIARANSLQELDQVLANNAARFRFESMQLGNLGSAASSAGRGHRGVWRFEYPVLLSTGDGSMHDTGETPMLTIVCSVSNGRPTGVERVVEVLAPAIAGWFSLRTLAAHELRAKMRPSGGSRRGGYVQSAAVDLPLSTGEYNDSAITP